MTTNDELIERCARAAYETRHRPYRWNDDVAGYERRRWLEVAAAVLAEAASETEPRPPVPDQDGEPTIPIAAVRVLARDLRSGAERKAGLALDRLLDAYEDSWPPNQSSGPRVAPEPREEAARRLRAAAETVPGWPGAVWTLRDLAELVEDTRRAGGDRIAAALLAGRPENDREPPSQPEG